MSKAAVKIVKYDMDRTKKRNRKNLLVSEKTEQAVISQLEKIHKGEKVETIHSIEWDDKETEKNVRKEVQRANATLTGEIKFFEESKGFGFIAPDDDMDDLFFHESTIGDEIIRTGDQVEFQLGESPKGVCAVKIKLIK